MIFRIFDFLRQIKRMYYVFMKDFAQRRQIYRNIQKTTDNCDEICTKDNELVVQLI